MVFALLSMSVPAVLDIPICPATDYKRVESFTLILISAVAILMVMYSLFSFCEFYSDMDMQGDRKY